MADYYDVLGVKKDASAEEIKKAYRRLAKKYHPDATDGDKSAEKKFIEINEAYETLGDDEKRRKYDARGERPVGAPFDASFDAGDLFADLFGGFSGQRVRRRPADVMMTREIAPWDAALGRRIEVRAMDKTLSVKVPPGSRTGQKLRLRGQGLSDGSGNTGDLVIELIIQNPANLAPEVKQFYEKMQSKQTVQTR